jgi:3-oxoacyl-[acyl-carrier-protein] synthase-3
MPATSGILQDRLGLNRHILSYDINQGCAGFVYGLSLGFSLLLQPGIRKVLLLDGETRSKVYSPKDRKTAFIFGDAGAAAILERGDEFGESHFSFHTDGSRWDLIKIDAGGYRNPSSEETLKEKVRDEYGNIRSDEQGYMNGPDVFNFLIREVPRDINGLLEYAQKNITGFSYYVFHQANAYMNNYLVKKMKLESSKVPMSIKRFGNTSSVSIPLTMVYGLEKKLKGISDVLLSGFGVGLAWASSTIRLQDDAIIPLIEI